jgi:hypothetical protein
MAAMDKTKMFELRVDDRGFEVGDTVILREWLPTMAQYADHEALHRRITYILRLKDFAMEGLGWQIARRLMPDLVILGLEAIE